MGCHPACITLVMLLARPTSSVVTEIARLCQSAVSGEACSAQGEGAHAITGISRNKFNKNGVLLLPCNAPVRHKSPQEPIVLSPAPPVFVVLAVSTLTSRFCTHATHDLHAVPLSRSACRSSLGKVKL
eukprot:564604-Pleurochrysis_carterae.AAC.3